MNHYPHTTVATVVPQQGRFLMVQEKSGESLVYNQPAGHVEVGEGLIAAAVRETFEETGWRVRVECLIGIYSHVHKVYSRNDLFLISNSLLPAILS